MRGIYFYLPKIGNKTLSVAFYLSALFGMVGEWNGLQFCPLLTPDDTLPRLRLHAGNTHDLHRDTESARFRSIRAGKKITSNGLSCFERRLIMSLGNKLLANAYIGISILWVAEL